MQSKPPRRRRLLWRYLLALVPGTLAVPLLGVALPLWGFFGMSVTALPSESWTRVTGVVTSLERGTRDAGEGALVHDPAGEGCLLTYAFVDGAGTERTASSGWGYENSEWCGLAVGSPIDVAYDPADPSHSQEDGRDAWEASMAVFDLVFAGIAVLFALSAVGTVLVVVGHVGNRRFRAAAGGGEPPADGSTPGAREGTSTPPPNVTV
ncbi:DUF3592 domain-containing protein [Sanguibacter sp. HDW7]|uniref:DUF3592 domain-containing protein n=1 Tax=Sanguibacter sp. HDW7 TaxID=2714931 RepID=UPI00140B227B|nr:DUF3592 domain-containing protein [Sanguibacter sp. HDW7]QIK83912.1 DUF3592 domain-containing protein [Sanguibacter sp. HDW7]